MKSAPNPPGLARRLFAWYCGNAQVDDLLGDMDEIFKRNLGRMPAWRAKMKYWSQILSLISSYAIRKRRQRAAFHPHSNNSINFHMIRNYFMIAGRMMARNKVYTIINVLGLTLGISACLIVYLVVSHEFSFDRFHADKERIYRIKAKSGDNVDEWFCDCISAPAYTTLRDGYTGAEAFTGYHQYDAKVLITGNGEVKRFDRNTTHVILTNPDYFKIFQYQWLAGNMNVLAKPLQVVLTESRARTYFGSQEPQEIIGKTITYNDSLHVSVAGIVKDWTKNSDFNQTEFISFSTIESTFLGKAIGIDNWGRIMDSSQSFIKLKEGDTPEDVAAGLAKVVRKNTNRPYAFLLQPLGEIHFNSGMGTLLSTLYVLTGLAGFILIIASINFINLSTAQSIKRSREIGIRKVMGSMKRQIIFQFLAETIVLTFIALVLSVTLTKPLLFAFGSYIPHGVGFDPLSMNNWLFMAGLLLVVSLIAGTYPALVLSSYLPAVTLSGRRLSVGRERWSLRKLLIVFQFSVSLFFIIATLVISSQMNFIRKTDRGFSAASVITFNTNWNAEISKVQTLVARLRQVPGLTDVAMQGSPPMGFAQWRSTFEYTGGKDKVEGLTSIKAGDDHYIPMYKFRLVAGRNILPSDTIKEIVINETLVKTLGLEEPQDAIGEQIRMNNTTLSICGVVQDFHQDSFRMAIIDCVIGNFTDQLHSIAIRLENPDIMANADLIARVESEFKQVYPDESFAYHFIEDEIGWMHGEEQKASNLATIAMSVTIFISCMGVFGLAMFTAAMRTREIGIRKVLGATTVGIVNMLSREFVTLILVSVVLATPVAWYYLSDWLLGFNYHTDLSWWFFVAAAGIALATGLITVSAQSFKAAAGDPVKALRSE